MKTFTKCFTLIMALAVVLSCGEKEQPVGGLGINLEGAVLGFDKNVIKADGNDQVTFSAYFNGNNVGNDAQTYFLRKNPVTGKFEYAGKTFSTTEPGEYVFKVQYKANHASEEVRISVITRDIPAAPADPQPSKTSFVHRTFFNQFTGVECPNCPYMVYLLDQTLVNGYEDKVVLAAIRNYSSKEAGFANVPNSAGYWPYLHIDYSKSYYYSGSAAELQSLIDQWTSTPAKVGISANPVYYEDGQIIVKVSVKAAETGEYNVGLWLMQDEYYMPQTIHKDVTSGALNGTWDNGYKGDSSKNRYDYHHNAVRVAASKYMGGHVGFPLGKIEAGKTAEWIFVVNVNLGTAEYSYTDHWWEGNAGQKINLDDLHFAAFVTSHKGSRYTVENAVDFKYNEAKAFDYK